MAAADTIVVGAGVTGLTTAVTLAETGHQVTVVADQIPGQTSLAAGASWGPYHVEPRDKVSSWSAHTLVVLTEPAATPGTGVRLVSGVEASRTAAAMPNWARHLPDVQPCQHSDLPHGFRTGWRYTVPVVDMPRYLDYLLARLHTAGGRIEQRRLASLSDVLGRAAVVVNCTGQDSAPATWSPTTPSTRSGGNSSW